MDAFMFTNPEIDEKEAYDAMFMTATTMIFDRHKLKFGRDWVVDDHIVSILKDVSREEEFEIANEIEGILG